MQSDPYLWLEDVTGNEALSWVRERNDESLAGLAQGERFTRLRDEIREVLDSDDRIPYVTRRGEFLYNFWRDAEHPRGLWRRTTLDSYRLDQPDWELLLDVDTLARSEDENWVWKGASVLRPNYDRALIELSRGGADAAVVREFSLETLEFLPDGFYLPEAKTWAGWIDGDRIYVGTDFGEGSLTSSGYPRIVKEWHRGTPISDATTVFEGEPDDVRISAYHDSTEGFERDFVHRAIEFYSGQDFFRTAENYLVKIDVPDDAMVGVHREWLLVETRTAWTVEDTTYPAGALLAARFDDFMAGSRDLAVVFAPDAHTSLSYYAWTKNYLLLNTLSDVKSRLQVANPPSDASGSWKSEPLAGLPEIGTTEIVGTDSQRSDEFFLDSSGFTEPSTLRYGGVGEELEILKQAPGFFNASDISVRQNFATSLDGTKIPYFIVEPASGAANGPVMLYGYGGFEVALKPSYSGALGRGWLAKGGTYVLANIRGGGEYGPDWHNSALRENRHRAYEDFAAVARDLVEQGLTTPSRLGIRGGSNGGLLMGVMLTLYPELFGAIAISVPLLDMKRYHKLLAGASWMAEWGDPDVESDWEFLQTYSPYHLVKPGEDYPKTLFVTSTRDDRVHPGHARKMVARMREFGYDVAYYENIEGGHGAAADNEQLAFRQALEFNFLWSNLT